jgi:uncharacterized protein
MNIINTILILTAFSVMTASAQDTRKQTKKHFVIMQVTQGDSLTQISVIGQIRNIKKSLPDAHIKVVCHANALDMLIEKKSRVLTHLSSLTDEDVVFAACENTMERKNVKKEDLSTHVVTVPSALVEIILKQEEGWSYIKGGM